MAALDVTSTLIGARRVKQLDDNLKSLEITLSTKEITHLDGLTEPEMPFPQKMQSYFPVFANGARRDWGCTQSIANRPLENSR